MRRLLLDVAVIVVVGLAGGLVGGAFVAACCHAIDPKACFAAGAVPLCVPPADAGSP